MQRIFTGAAENIPLADVFRIKTADARDARIANAQEEVAAARLQNIADETTAFFRGRGELSGMTGEALQSWVAANDQTTQISDAANKARADIAEIGARIIAEASANLDATKAWIQNDCEGPSPREQREAAAETEEKAKKYRSTLATLALTGDTAAPPHHLEL